MSEGTRRSPIDPARGGWPGTDAAPSTPKSRGSSPGSFLGTAMLGLEQALRREPPAEVIVREHQPERGISGAEGDFSVQFPLDPDPDVG